jgi:HK97 family phage portal protein
MTYLQKLFSQAENSLSEEEERFWSDSYQLKTNSGTRVTPESALKISTAWACMRLISETAAMLPRIIYKRMADGGKTRATGHPLYDILHNQPNNLQTAFEFVDMMQMHCLLRGSGYAKILPGPRGPVDRLIPVVPDRILDKERIGEDAMRYKVLELDGSVNVYLQDQIFELKGLSLDGLNTVSPVTYNRESLGLTLAAEKYGAKLFSNYSRPGGVLKHPGVLSTGAQDRLRDQVEARTSGDNVHRVMVLEEGMEWQQISFSPEDSQMLQTREFQAEDVCRWYRTNPIMVGLTSKTTSWGSGVYELSQGFINFTMMPWLTRWEQLVSKDLIVASDQYYMEYLTEALMKGDLLKRYQAYAIGRNWGWLATNDVLKKENMNPTSFGDDDYLTPMNMDRSMDLGIGNDSSNQNDKKDSNQNAHYRKLVQESAARAARKELAAMTHAAEKKESSDWYAAVNAFYKDHVEFVAQTMCISFKSASEYAERGRLELTEKGPLALEGWADRRASELTRITLMEVMK